MKKSFTLLELIFVIIIIGILAGIAIPRLFTGVDDAVKVKIKTEAFTIRTAISLKYIKLILKGNNSYPVLKKSLNNKTLFENILITPIYKEEDMLKWDGNETDYNVTYHNKTIYFYYDNDPDHGCLFKCIVP